ncbi:Hypothetical predicted protein [Lecanosticta acicola]|uniref:Asteroid domain-containing protein n=1 Tax=Lecanosticta acicola TaxID=111012 RepID=A0AAI8Z3U7_9PEZI|nr:Hypothetical predicted protein [Lecanosticta acicola]
MGIKGFGSRMSAYAQRTHLGSTSDPARDAVAIVDGPGLAHYVYYGLCGKREGSQKPITYTECAQAALEWLDLTQAIGMKIGAILFDGALPHAKRSVRIGRLQAYAEKVHVYKQSDKAGMLLDGRARKRLPPPPFLVFAVVEELRQSKYGHVTYVVPGEADPYCIIAAIQVSDEASETTVTIFSDDSDLLVYNLGQRSVCVAPFRDLDDEQTISGTTRSAEVYWPTRIAAQASVLLEDLVKPAFFMSEDPYCTFDEALLRIKKKDPSDREDFKAFGRGFQTTEEKTEWLSITTDSSKKRNLAACDSRVSEIICQTQSLRAGSLEGGVKMYLPFLIDDPGRASAWNVGTNIRALAYSLLLRCEGLESEGAQEYRRSGSRITGNLMELISLEETEEQLRASCAYFDEFFEWAKGQDLCDADTCRSVVLSQTCQYAQAGGHSLPGIKEAQQLVQGRAEGRLRAWHLVHLSAEYQAAYYSLRILHQIASHVVAHGSIAKDVASLVRARLSTLPRIGQFFEESQEQQSWVRVIPELMANFEAKDTDEEPVQKKRRKKTKWTKWEKEGSGQEDASGDNNPFALLMDD